jgi:hypothetical protein
VLARVPSNNGPWKPHPKSYPLGHLAHLGATMPPCGSPPRMWMVYLAK